MFEDFYLMVMKEKKFKINEKSVLECPGIERVYSKS